MVMRRPYICFSCKETAEAITIPENWLSLKRSRNSKLDGAGLFCSMDCLLDYYDNVPPISATAGKKV